MKKLLAAAALAGLWSMAAATPLMPTQYDMPNGSGEASGGNFNYWDLNYSGSGSTSTDGAALSGGLGDLTDGVVTNLNWIDVENDAGTGPYVGWVLGVSPDPVVTFAFASLVDIDTVRVHADDSNGNGGVDLPSRVRISWAGGNADFSVTDPATADPQWLTFSGLGIGGVSSVSVQFFHRNQWVFVDEVQFDGQAVPLPGTLALASLGLVALRRRRH